MDRMTRQAHPSHWDGSYLMSTELEFGTLGNKQGSEWSDRQLVTAEAWGEEARRRGKLQLWQGWLRRCGSPLRCAPSGICLPCLQVFCLSSASFTCTYIPLLFLLLGICFSLLGLTVSSFILVKGRFFGFVTWKNKQIMDIWVAIYFKCQEKLREERSWIPAELNSLVLIQQSTFHVHLIVV